MIYQVKSSSEIGFKDLDTKQGIVTGYLSTFDILDRDGDIIKKGAFSKTIQERGPKAKKNDIKFLQDHDRFKVVGVFQELKEDDMGLYYEGKVGNHTAGQDFIKLIEQGIISQHSIGYRVIKSQKATEGNILSEIYLYEGSGLQVDAANPHTPILSVKSEKDLLTLFDGLTKALESGTYSDETFERIIVPNYEKIKALITKSEEATLPSITEIKQALKLISYGIKRY